MEWFLKDSYRSRGVGWWWGVAEWLIILPIPCKARLFPDASLVKASAPESRSATQVAPLEISDS